MKFDYLMIGGGKLATHLEHYFKHLKLDFIQVDPRAYDQAEKLALQSKTVLLAISDCAIEAYYNQHLKKYELDVVHFSGALSIKGMQSCHPLMCFTEDLYTLEKYLQIPFICEKGKKSFSEIFPKLSNPHFEIDPEKKALYHALCVMGGNFTTLLWQEVIENVEKKLGLAKEILFPYLEQTIINLKKDHKKALTGPLAREDQKTISKNIDSLEQNHLQQTYQNFVHLYKQRRENENSRLH